MTPVDLRRMSVCGWPGDSAPPPPQDDHPGLAPPGGRTRHRAHQSTRPHRRRQIIGKFLVLAEPGDHVTYGDLPPSAVIGNKYSAGSAQLVAIGRLEPPSGPQSGPEAP